MNKRSLQLISLIVKENPWAVAIVCMCLLVSSLIEALGVSAIFPLISTILGANADLPDSVLGDFIGLLSGVDPYILAGVVVTSFLLKALILHLAYSVIAHYISSFAHKLRCSFVESMLSANIHYIQNKALGENLSILTNDSIRAAAAYVSATRILAGFFQVCLYAFYALWLSVEATLLSILSMALLIFVVRNTLSRTREAGNLTTQYIHEISKYMGAALRGIKAAKAMGNEGFLMTRLLSGSDVLRKAHETTIIVAQVLRNVQEPILIASALFCLLMFRDFLHMEPGYIVFVLAVYYRLMTSVNVLQADYQKFLGQESGLWSIIKSSREADDRKEVFFAGDMAPPKNVQDIVFDKVAVRIGKKEIFSNFSESIPACKLTVIKGQSGKGKTTIIDMICMLIGPSNGLIKVGDMNLSAVDAQSWRNEIGYVDQFPFLFKGSLRENIVLDNASNLSDCNIKQCLSDCNMSDFLERLPEGLDYELKEGGENISGGQRQRIAIARAIINNPRYLILDEPTSALDVESEAKIFETLERLSKQMTVIVVSHSQNFSGYADHIIDLDKN